MLLCFRRDGLVFRFFTRKCAKNSHFIRSLKSNILGQTFEKNLDYTYMYPPCTLSASCLYSTKQPCARRYRYNHSMNCTWKDTRIPPTKNEPHLHIKSLALIYSDSMPTCLSLRQTRLCTSLERRILWVISLLPTSWWLGISEGLAFCLTFGRGKVGTLRTIEAVTALLRSVKFGGPR